MDQGYVTFHQRQTIERNLIKEGLPRAQAVAAAKAVDFGLPSLPVPSTLLFTPGAVRRGGLNQVSMLKAAREHDSPLVRERRTLVLAATESPAHVQTALIETFISWFKATVASRGGDVAIMRGDVLALSAFLSLDALALPFGDSFRERIVESRDAALLLASLAAAGLLQPSGPQPAAAAADAPEAAAEATEAAEAAPAAADSTPACDKATAFIAWLDDRLHAFENRTALHHASSVGDVPTLTRLLAMPGQDIDEPLPGWPPSGDTCLALAAGRAPLGAVEWLLGARAAPNAPCCDGWTPLHAAAQRARGSGMVTALLLAHGAHASAATRREGTTPLHIAAMHGQMAAARALLAAGADPLLRDRAGIDAPAHARVCRDKAFAACVCDTHAFAPQAEYAGTLTILTLAATMPPAERLEWAEAQDEGAIAAALVDAVDADVAAAGRGGKGAAAPSALAPLLRCYRSHVDARDVDGTTALHAAAQAGACAVVTQLLDARADVGAPTPHGETALHCAAADGHAAVASLLIERGADVQAATRGGSTARDYALRDRSRGWEALVALLDAQEVAAAVA